MRSWVASSFLPQATVLRSRCLTSVCHRSQPTSSRLPHFYNVRTRQSLKIPLSRIGVRPRKSPLLRFAHALSRRCLLCGPGWHIPQGRQRTEPCLPRGSPYHTREPSLDCRHLRCHHRRERILRIRRELCLEGFRFRGRRG